MLNKFNLISFFVAYLFCVNRHLKAKVSKHCRPQSQTGQNVLLTVA